MSEYYLKQGYKLPKSAVGYSYLGKLSKIYFPGGHIQYNSLKPDEIHIFDKTSFLYAATALGYYFIPDTLNDKEYKKDYSHYTINGKQYSYITEESLELLKTAKVIYLHHNPDEKESGYTFISFSPDFMGVDYLLTIFNNKIEKLLGILCVIVLLFLLLKI